MDEVDSTYVLIDSSSNQRNYSGVGFKHFRAVFYKKSIYLKRKMTYFFIMVRLIGTDLEWRHLTFDSNSFR